LFPRRIQVLRPQADLSPKKCMRQEKQTSRKCTV